MATANDPRRIPAPVRSRFVEFTIQAPDIDGRLALAHAIYAATLARLVPRRAVRARFRPLTNMQICRLAWLTPRQMRMAVEHLLGIAALQGRWHLDDADFDAVLPKAADPAQVAPRRRDDDPGDPFALVVVDRQ
jgi:hypothetical protein